MNNQQRTLILNSVMFYSNAVIDFVFAYMSVTSVTGVNVAKVSIYVRDEGKERY